MKELKNRLSIQRRSMVSLLLFSVLIGLLAILQAYLLVSTVDQVFLKEAGFSDILPVLLGLLAVLMARTAASYWNGRTGIKMASKVKKDFRSELLQHFSRSSPVQSSFGGQSGRKVSVMLDAVDEVDSYFSEYIPQVLQACIVPIFVLVAVFTQHVNSGLIMLITAPFIPIFMIVIGIQTKKKSEEQLEKMAAFSGKFLDTLQGLTTLKLFGRAKRQKEEIEKGSIGFREATMEILKIAFMNSFALEVVTMLSIGLVALELAIQLIIYESISFFTAFLVLLLVPEFYNSLKDLGNAFHNGKSSMGAAATIQEELEQAEEGCEWGGRKIMGKEPPAIKLEEVSFSYGAERFALQDIHAYIPPGSQAAIVGRSGSGKTTLLHLMAGLVPPGDGRILANGHPLSSYQEQEWFNRLSYITQHPYIFSGTIRENIAIGANGEPSDSDIMHAAEQAGLSHMIEDLEQGYDTPVGEAGRGLSGGEMQRLALARAFLKKPSVILFDEPTTGLDLQTEQVLQSSIDKLARHATIITVAHRLHTIQDADIIFYLKNGMVAASGKHEELMEVSADYHAMVTAHQGGQQS
ncbi:thiol reductant ABC exporter subunit CydD [Virgibacillus xinjiangensis]|uniref:Thiol reductant ABC exporter subunit CydD n=1 Tax=Virgibacillus xinjiangensis TaxID=393090 RepID=A0ABV7CZM5_9BACI